MGDNTEEGISAVASASKEQSQTRESKQELPALTYVEKVDLNLHTCNSNRYIHTSTMAANGNNKAARLAKANTTISLDTTLPHSRYTYELQRKQS